MSKIKSGENAIVEFPDHLIWPLLG